MNASRKRKRGVPKTVARIGWMLFVIGIGVFYGSAGVLAQSPITGTWGFTAHELKIDEHHSPQRVGVSEIIGRRVMYLGPITLDGIRNRVSVDVKAVEMDVDFDDASGRVGANLEVFRMGIARETGKADRRYLYAQGRIPGYALELQMEFKDGLEAMTTGMVKTYFPEKKWRLVLKDEATGRETVWWEGGTGPAYRDNRIHSDLAEALQEANMAGKLLLVDFYGAWCPWSVRMDRTFADPTVQTLLARGFHYVKLDIGRFNRHTGCLKRYDVKAIPRLIVFNADGSIRASHEGYMTVPKCKAFLQKQLGPEGGDEGGRRVPPWLGGRNAEQMTLFHRGGTAAGGAGGKFRLPEAFSRFQREIDRQ